MDFNWANAEQQWRKDLLSHASGTVLEAGVGTGENFRYYPRNVIVTAVDSSAKIIEKAKEEAGRNEINARFIISPIEDLLLPEHSFDTVVSTFLLSNHPDAEKLLVKFGELCKPDGMILLMEYGLSKNGLVSWLQQKWEPFHYRRNGSHINRNLPSLITGSGLSIRKMEVRYVGMVYMVWATLTPAKHLTISKV